MEKHGWFNECVFRDNDVDTHTLSIKMGQAMEIIYTEIAQLRYPGRLLPRALAGHGVSEEEAEKYWTHKFENNHATERKNAIIILNRLDKVQTSKALAGEVAKYFCNHGKDRVRFSHNIMGELSNRMLEAISLQSEIREVCVDLCPNIDGVWTLMEIKMSGDIDRGKTKQVFTDNMLLPYVCLGNKPKKVFME